jgi:hypothetical protein
MKELIRREKNLTKLEMNKENLNYDRNSIEVLKLYLLWKCQLSNKWLHRIRLTIIGKAFLSSSYNQYRFEI